MSDRIVLTGVRAHGHHGVLAEERRNGQDFVVDVELVIALAAAAATDDVAATVHYGELAERIVAAVERDPVDLIETLAERIAAIVLEQGPVERAVVTVHKPDAPIAVPFADVAVRVEREQPGREEHAVIALGANLGDRDGTLDGAVAALRRLRGFEVEAVSRSHETVAITTTGPDPARPAYLNRVLIGRTSLPAGTLLEDLLGIERAFGRTRGTRWGDRTLDLDLIALGSRRIDQPGLVLPHPAAHERDFVLLPWLEIEPDAVLPGYGRVAELTSAVAR